MKPSILIGHPVDLASFRERYPDLQIDALKQAGCRHVYTDYATGVKAKREKLQILLDTVQQGDVIVIWKLDRLGRSLKHLVELVTELNERSVGLVSLRDPIDTTTAQGKLMFHIFASLAEFERDVIRERTQAGLQAARLRGRTGGRPKGLSKEAEKTAAAAEALYKAGDLSVSEITERLGIGRSTLYKYLRHRGTFVDRSNAKA